MQRTVKRIAGQVTGVSAAFLFVVGMTAGPAAGAETPDQIEAGAVVAIDAGWEHSLALTSDGTVWGWGRNDTGAVGDGTTESHRRPVQVINLSAVVGIAAGHEHSL